LSWKTELRPTLNVIGEELIVRILDEAKRILAETGMEIRGPEMRQRLLDLGLNTDAGGRRILFPPDVVERAVQNAPSTFTLYDRDGEPRAVGRLRRVRPPGRWPGAYRVPGDGFFDP
jgi:trimethylamine--corrinoid protein Co-methyltransferase